jgi:hypothetical protein
MLDRGTRRALRRSLFLPIAFGLLAMGALAGTAVAQLDETCTVSVLNRTAVVDSEGTWVLPNVPSTMGLVRARATCVASGLTRAGQSDFFAVPTDGIVRGVEIHFDVPAPVPSAIVLSALKTTLQTVGETVQLSVRASLPDGTSVDVTPANAGTTYRSTSPGVVSVSDAGVVTAQGGGVALISAFNDGALALLRVSVSSTLDSDHDGMPDDWEIANGLNPNDPSDASQDPDHDGLTNLQEYQHGTNPHLADTDGDGLSDGVEVQTGSDPLDPASYNLATALRGIHLNPPAVVLVVNSLFGSASRTVQVLGDVIDGSTIDLTSHTRGTTYQSSDLTVASFGTTDGEIFAGRNGGAVLTAANSGFTATASISVSAFSPIPLSWLTIPGYANNVRTIGNLCYVAAGAAGLQIVDVTNRRAPQILGSYDTAGNADDVRVIGTTAYVADGPGGLVVIDVSIPTQPRLIATLPTPGEARALVLTGGRAYVADGADGFRIVDISNPATPVLLGGYSEAGVVAQGIDLQATTAVLATTAGIRVLDVTNASAPVLVSALATTDARGVRVRGTVAYVADFTGSLVLVDLSTPSAPRMITSTPPQSGGYLNDVALFGDFGFGADVFFVNGVPITYLGQPGAALVRGRLDFPFRDDNGMGVDVDASYVYLAAVSGSISKPGTSGLSALYIGQYMPTTDTFGVPPTATLTSPSAGSSFIEGTPITLAATATDDVGVSSVNFLADSQVVGAVTTAPYTMTVPARLGATSMRFSAQAVDFGGNIGTSADVVVTIIRDTTAPTVSLNSPSNGQSFPNFKVITFSASASDAGSGVGRVDFLVNGTVVGSAFSSPYTSPYTLPAAPASLTVAARAYDRAGNATDSNAATITVFHDDPPTVSFSTTLGPGGVLFGGGELHVSATASDDHGVSEVDLLLDGVIVKSLTRAPYAFTGNVPNGVSTVTVNVRAVDTIGQVTLGTSQTYTVSPTSVLSSTPVTGFANQVSTNGTYAYIAAGAGGLQITDVSDPSHPSVISTVPIPGNANGVVARGGYAFVAAGTAGLQVVNVASPATAAVVGSLPFAAPATRIVQRNDRVYVTDALGVEIIDIRNPRVPRLVSRIRTIHNSLAFATDGTVAVLLSASEPIVGLNACSSCQALSVIDLSDELNPRFTSSIALDRSSTTVVLSGGRAYVGGSPMAIVDLSNLALPKVLGTYDNNFNHFSFNDLAPLSGLTWTAAADFTNFALLLPTSDPANIFVLGGIKFTALGGYEGTSIAATPELIYTTGSTVRLTSGPGTSQGTSGLYIGRYATIVDTAGVAPQVQIDTPSAGATFVERQVLPIRAMASDDIAVKSVAFFVDGVQVGQASVAPYETLYDLPGGSAGVHTVTARATDFAGNTTMSPPVSITVATDTTAPTVRITAPSDGEGVPGGSARISVTASDDFSVARVDLFANGQPIATLNTPPYDFEYALPSGPSATVLTARATDPAGNATDSSSVTITAFAPALLASIPIPATVPNGLANSIAVNGSYAYVVVSNSLGASGVQIIDISNPNAPQVAGFFATANPSIQVRILGNLLYVSENGPTEIVDVSNPLAPRLLGTAPFGRVLGVTGTSIYSGGGTVVHRFDASVPSAPQLLGTETDGGLAISSIDAFGLYAVSGATVTLNSLFSNLTSYLFPGTFTNVNASLQLPQGTRIGAVRIINNYVAAATSNGLVVTNAADRLLWNTTRPGFNLWSIDSSGNSQGSIDIVERFIGAAASDRTLLYDATTATDPQLRASMTFTDGGDLAVPKGIALTPTLILVTTASLHFDGSSSTTARFFVARYRTISDTRGVAPIVSVTAPTTVKTGRLAPFQAIATDDVAVASVVFTVNGVDVFTDTIAPFEFNYLVPTGTSTLTVTARAIDYAGNSTTSAPVTVAVTP